MESTKELLIDVPNFLTMWSFHPIKNVLLKELEDILRMFPPLDKTEWYLEPHTMPSFVPPSLSDAMEFPFVGKYRGEMADGDVRKMDDGSLCIVSHESYFFIWVAPGEQLQLIDGEIKNLTATLFYYNYIMSEWRSACDTQNDRPFGKFAKWNDGKLFYNGEIDGDIYTDAFYNQYGNIDRFETLVMVHCPGESDEPLRCDVTIHNESDSSLVSVSFRGKKYTIRSNFSLFRVFLDGQDHKVPTEYDVNVFTVCEFTEEEDIVANGTSLLWTFDFCSHREDWEPPRECDVEIRTFGLSLDTKNKCTILNSDDHRNLKTVEKYSFTTGELIHVREPSRGFIYGTQRLAWIETVVKMQKRMW